MMKSRLLWSLLLFIITLANSFAQTDTEFWFVAPEVSKNGTSNFDIPIYLRITTFDDPATVTVSEPANPGFVPVVVNIPANGFSTVDLSAFVNIIENKPANSILNFGLHIVATSPVSIYYEIASTYCNCNPELYTLKGKNAVGLNFLIPTQNYFSNAGGYNPTPYNAFDIVATEDNTTVTITPTKNIVGHTQNIPFEIVLNQGQTWSAVATSQLAANHLFGSSVIATKPIAITMTDDLLHGITGCADIIGDQIVPVGITGTEYIAVKGNLTNNGNRAFILATQDNTEVFIDGNVVPAATLNTGELFNNNILSSSTYIVSSKPVYVFQTSGFGCELGGALLPPIFCTGSTRVVFARTTNQQLGLVLTTHSGDEGNFLVNGDPTMITAANFLPVPGTGGSWVSANLTLSLAQIPVGTIVSITNTTGTFHLGLMIGDVGGGCSYGYYSDFSRLNLGPDLVMCPGDTRTLDAGDGWTSFLWNTGATTQSITVSLPGSYSVIATDPGCTLMDTAIVSLYPATPVSLGPDVTICQGESTTFDAGFCNGCTYLWANLSAGQPNIGTGQTLSASTAGTYMVSVTPSNGCTGRDTIQLFNDPLIPVSISVSADLNPVCDGTTVVFTAFPTNPGLAPVYQWYINALPVGVNSQTHQYTPASADIITCTVTSSLACTSGNPASSNQVIMVVNPNNPVSVTLTSSTNHVCSGDPVIFTALPVNPGNSPYYQWRVNGSVQGPTLNLFTYVPADGDCVACELTSDINCATGNPALSNSICITVDPLLPVSVSVSVSANPVCPGTSVTFTALPVHGGTNPFYQWKLNGTAAGTNNPVFICNLSSGDLVSCILTSSEICSSGNPASSIPILMNTLAVPVVTFTPCFDMATTVNAQPIQLKGGLPLGGTYSGPGVNSTTGVFTPSAAGVGTHSITYSYTNALLCSESKQLLIINSPLLIFNCGSPLTDIRDNKVYPTVLIGTQCWMQTNLDFGITINDLIHQTDNCIAEKYDRHVSPVTRHAFYQWDELMLYDATPGLQGLCPPGWHVPTEAEWTTLFNYYQGNSQAGRPLQDQYNDGFMALQSGVLYLNSTWSFADFATMFWSSTMADQTKAFAHGMNTVDHSVSIYAGLKANAFSVRCLKD